MDALWIAIGAVAVTLLNLYWDVLKPELAKAWKVAGANVAWKIRYSLKVAVVAVWEMLKLAYKRGLLDAIISIIVRIIKNKLGIPTAMRKAGLIK